MKKIIVSILLSLSGFGPSLFAQTQRHASLADQKACAIQAKRAFLESDSSKPWKSSDGYRDLFPAEYTSHFDTTASVCYVLVARNYTENTKAGLTVWISTTIWDAFEGRGYASFLWHSDKDKRAWEQPPNLCSVKPRGQEEILCKSEDEFDALTDKYFGVR